MAADQDEGISRPTKTAKLTISIWRLWCFCFYLLFLFSVIDHSAIDLCFDICLHSTVALNIIPRHPLKAKFCAAESHRTCPSKWLFIPSHFLTSRRRVYKKTSSNQLLTLYLGTRELVSRAGVIDPIKGIIYIDPRVVESNQKVYCQLTLTFRWVELNAPGVNGAKTLQS